MTDEARAGDARLADRIRSGETQALGELYDRYGGMALATALRVVGSREEAEDVVHDAFVTIWRKIDRFDAQRGSLRAWLMTVVRNRGIDRIRARRSTVDIEAADERSLLRTGPNPTWDAVVTRTSINELREALATLPEEQRRSVELAYFEGYTYREVATLTGVPAGTANGRMRLALSKLRDALSGSSTSPNAPRDGAFTEEATS